MTRSPYSIIVNRNDISSVLLNIYASNASILSTSLSVTFKGEDATDLSGGNFFTDIQEKYFDGNMECVPHVDPQTCQSLSSLDDTMFTTTMGEIFSHGYVLTGVFPIFIARASLQSVLLTSCVDDSLLISSFLRYVDEFEQDTLKSVMNGDINADIDEEVYDNVVLT